MGTIKVYAPDSVEYLRLVMASAALTLRSRKGTTYRVDETYFDLGQGWMWTTIIATMKNGDHYQALSPRDHEKIVTLPDTAQVIEEIISDKYWCEC